MGWTKASRRCSWKPSTTSSGLLEVDSSPSWSSSVLAGPGAGPAILPLNSKFQESSLELELFICHRQAMPCWPESTGTTLYPSPGLKTTYLLTWGRGRGRIGMIFLKCISILILKILRESTTSKIAVVLLLFYNMVIPQEQGHICDIVGKTKFNANSVFYRLKWTQPM